MACVTKKSINSGLRILQLKWLMRIHPTPVKLNKYNRNIPDICIKRGLKGMWECSQIKTLWLEVKNLIEKIITKQIMLDSKLFTMALYPNKHDFGKAESTFIDFSSLIAQPCIALNWKNMSRPRATRWHSG